MNRFIEHIGNLYSIILTILTLFLGEHWILVLLSFVIPVCFKELGAVINIDLSILAFLGWYVLASLIINEYRSILENLVEAGCDVPQVLVKGLEVASKKIDNFNENE